MTRSTKSCTQLFDLFHLFAIKFVLEVLGAAGAVWGCSEAIGWRTSKTLWFWRPFALLIGLVFGIRWMGQLRRLFGTFPATSIHPDSTTPESEISMVQEPESEERYIDDGAIVESDLLLQMEYGTTA